MSRFLQLSTGLMLIALCNETALSNEPIVSGSPKDIRKLSQHFLTPDNVTTPWTFVPQENIARLSTTDHAGVLTLSEAGKGKDIKGVLESPIKIDDYPLPWEFHLGLIQNYQAMKGISERQINFAIGLNLAVTFSDPATWPKDRSRTPEDTHTLQLFVVHLGNVGENYRTGVPRAKATALNQFDPSPEVYLVYGRGDLSSAVNGNWKMGYTWLGHEGSISGSWSKGEGPANSIVRFRASLLNPTTLQVGVGYGDHPGWRMRTIDVSRFGKITGIWEIGPVISLDHWIPKILAAELELDQAPEWLKSFRLRWSVEAKSTGTDEALLNRLEELFKVEQPDPAFEYYVDYAVFYGNGPENLDHLSDEFDIPGFLADQKWYIEGNAIAETYSNPGYSTVTLLGMNGGWAMCPIVSGDAIDLARFKPPIEFETAFIAADDKIPWNLWWTFSLIDSDGKNLGQGWNPGVQNIPGQGRSFINHFGYDPQKIVPGPLLNIPFDRPPPQSLLTSKPLFMLMQVMDETHLRVGFKAAKGDPWTFSQTLDTKQALGKTIGKIGYPCLASMQGRLGDRGCGIGNYPRYQRFLFDYVRFGYGLSK
jgi:hypothetical protein